MKKLSEFSKTLTFDDRCNVKDITRLCLLDEVITPACKSGNLVIIGSSKKCGKTQLATQTAVCIAEFQGQPVLYFSLKDSAEWITKRMFAQRFYCRKVFGMETIKDEDKKILHLAFQDTEKLPVYLEDDTPISIILPKNWALF